MKYIICVILVVSAFFITKKKPDKNTIPIISVDTSKLTDADTGVLLFANGIRITRDTGYYITTIFGTNTYSEYGGAHPLIKGNITPPSIYNPCQIVQRYYLKGKLVQELIRDSTIIEHKCLNFYSIRGKDVWADSIVTTLR